MIKEASKREMARWYPLKHHAIQQALVDDKILRKVVPAGRRSGKSERAKRFVVREAFTTPGHYFIAAPTRDQVKRVYWDDIKLLSFASILPSRPRETDLIIPYPNGSTISLIGLDRPERMEGVAWDGGIIDEIGNTREGAWAENISPALATVDPTKPGRRPWCWLIGVPEGMNHYADIAAYARDSGDPDWKLYTWPSSDILPAEELAKEKARMSARQYRQEYEACFENATGRIYEDYGSANITTETLQPHEQIYWMHDFNYTPLSSAVGVRRGNSLYIVGEIVLTSAVASQSATEFVARYKYHQNRAVIVYGDPAGKAGEKHSQVSNYLDLEGVLRSAGWSVERRVKAEAPWIIDRQNAVRAKILSADGTVSLFVNPILAPTAHKGLGTVQIKPGSAFIEVVSDSQHITTAIGYMIEYEWPTVAPEDDQRFIPAPTVHYWR